MSCGEGEGKSLEFTPTWVVALFCTVIVAILLAVERFLHYGGEYLKKKNQKPLFEALLKIKEELMLLGFISLLLTVFQNPITKICVSPSLTRHMIPCRLEDEKGESKEPSSSSHFQKHFSVSAISGTVRRLLADGSAAQTGYCSSKGKVPLLSMEALHHLHIFIFVLAIVHVTFCVLTVLFGGAKLRKWKHWEDSNVSALPQHVFISHERETIGVTRTLEKARPAATGNAISHPSGERKELNDYDPKLSELKVTSSINGVEADKAATHLQDCAASAATGNAISHPSGERKELNDYPKLSELKVTSSINGFEADKAATHLQDCAASEANDASNGGIKGDCKGKVQSSSCTGAKKRKSGCVKRFRKDFQEFLNIAAKGISDAVNEHMQTSLPDPVGNNSCPDFRIHDSKNSGIFKIIKAIGYSASRSSSGQDVFVSFKALRYDGTEVTVDNQYLKTYSPLLLINFYEQHLRYQP